MFSFRNISSGKAPKRMILGSHNKLIRSVLILLILPVFAYSLVSGYALISPATIETESGAITGAASVLSDTAASGGNAVYFGNTGSALSCDVSATTATFASKVSTATAGQTICLQSGNYGTWSGTNKAITIAAADGATPTMVFNFGSGVSGFTLHGISGLSGTISGSANNIRIEYSTFAGETDVLMNNMQNANIVFDHDHFPGFVGTARVWTYNQNAGGPSGVVIQNSLFDNPSNLAGIADGVRCDGASIQILNNEFSGINDSSSGGNHGDPIQIYGGTHCIIKGNYFHGMINSATCSLGEWDGGDNNVFENNVVHTGGCYEAVGILADTNSLIDHNTFIAPSSGCLANPQSECASVATGAKTGSSGSGTVYRDNVMAGIANGNGGVNASYTEHHNLCLSSCGGTGDLVGVPILVGGSNATTWAGHKLTSGSPGYNAASDGLSMGIN